MKEYNCPKCNAEFTLGVKFCNKCGCNLELEFVETPTCPICEKTFPIGTKFCSEHGANLVSPEQLIPRCDKCGKQYTDGTKFCLDCGGNVRVILKNRNLSANDLTNIALNVVKNLRNNSLGVLAGTVGVILFSFFNWIRISFMGEAFIKATIFDVIGTINKLESTIRWWGGDMPTEFTIVRIVSVILMIILILSFAMLIISFFVKPQLKAKSTLAYCGFGLCTFVTTIFILVMAGISIAMEFWILTVFPFFTLAIAIAAMIFAVKRPTKSDFLNAKQEIKKMRVGSKA